MPASWPELPLSVSKKDSLNVDYMRYLAGNDPNSPVTSCFSYNLPSIYWYAFLSLISSAQGISLLFPVLCAVCQLNQLVSGEPVSSSPGKQRIFLILILCVDGSLMVASTSVGAGR